MLTWLELLHGQQRLGFNWPVNAHLLSNPYLTCSQCNKDTSDLGACSHYLKPVRMPVDHPLS